MNATYPVNSNYSRAVFSSYLHSPLSDYLQRHVLLEVLSWLGRGPGASNQSELQFCSEEKVREGDNISSLEGYRQAVVTPES